MICSEPSSPDRLLNRGLPGGPFLSDDQINDHFLSAAQLSKMVKEEEEEEDFDAFDSFFGSDSNLMVNLAAQTDSPFAAFGSENKPNLGFLSSPERPFFGSHTQGEQERQRLQQQQQHNALLIQQHHGAQVGHSQQQQQPHQPHTQFASSRNLRDVNLNQMTQQRQSPPFASTEQTVESSASEEGAIDFMEHEELAHSDDILFSLDTFDIFGDFVDHLGSGESDAEQGDGDLVACAHTNVCSGSRNAPAGHNQSNERLLNETDDQGTSLYPNSLLQYRLSSGALPSPSFSANASSTGCSTSSQLSQPFAHLASRHSVAFTCANNSATGVSSQLSNYKGNHGERQDDATRAVRDNLSVGGGEGGDGVGGSPTTTRSQQGSSTNSSPTSASMLMACHSSPPEGNKKCLDSTLIIDSQIENGVARQRTQTTQTTSSANSDGRGAINPIGIIAATGESTEGGGGEGEGGGGRGILSQAVTVTMDENGNLSLVKSSSAGSISSSAGTH